MRGNGNVLLGIKDIYEQDVLRRTLNLSGSDKFDSTLLQNSIHASIFTVLNKYFNFSTNIILGVSGIYFKLLVFTTFIFVIYNFINKKKNSRRDLIMFIVFL